jgi:hypothetical protein
MSELSRGAAALVRAGRTAFRPEASDRERMLQSLTGALGDGALLGGASQAPLAKSAAGARFLSWGWVLAGVGGLAVGAAVVVAPFVFTKTTPPAVTPSVVSAPQPLTAMPNEGEQAPAPPVAQGAVDSPRPSARSSLGHPPDSLAEEVRLVSKAEQQLYAGHADDALKTLGEHERRFPNGALAEPRMAARVQSLCTLGRIADARADLTKLARAYPSSPQLDRARRFCGFSTP